MHKSKAPKLIDKPAYKNRSARIKRIFENIIPPKSLDDLIVIKHSDCYKLHSDGYNLCRFRSWLEEL